MVENDNLIPFPEEEVRFVIDSDDKAEWALGKIRDAQAERDRLLELVKAQEQKLDEQKRQILTRYSNDTEHLSYLLWQYMQTVKTRSTKTQDSYRLLSGTLVQKRGYVAPVVKSDDELCVWLLLNGHEDLVKTSPKWGELKKQLAVDPDTGTVTLAETGEFVDGVEAIYNPSKFEIKIN